MVSHPWGQPEPTKMVRLGLTKKTVAVLLCLSTVGVILILNGQLSSSTRRRARYETRHTLSMPLTLDLSKNITFLRIPDSNNAIHRFRLERISDEEEEEDYWQKEKAKVKGEEERQQRGGYGATVARGGDVVGEHDNTAMEEAEDNFGDTLDGKVKAVQPVPDQTLKKPPHEHAKALKNAVVGDQEMYIRNVTKVKQSLKNNYLLTVPDPRYHRMVAKVLSKLPNDVKRDMTLNIRMAEAKSNSEFMKIPSAKQWEVILKVFTAKGYEQRFPDVINIGVKKSGTNALGFFLPQHPQIVHSIGNEVHYFDWMYDKGLGYYKSRMGFAKRQQMIFEKTPRYFVTAEAPGRIKHDLPTNPKFILCVRDPIARLISDFRHESELKLRKEFKKNRAKYASRTGEFEGQRLRGEILDARGRVNASNELVDTSVYVRHYKNWLRHFPAERILVIDQDRMEKDVYHEMRRLEDFLNLRPYFKPSMFYFDDAKHLTCMRESHMPLRNCPAKSTPSVLPKAIIDPQTLAKLQEFYRPFSRELAQLTGMQFSWAD